MDNKRIYLLAALLLAAGSVVVGQNVHAMPGHEPMSWCDHQQQMHRQAEGSTEQPVPHADRS